MSGFWANMFCSRVLPLLGMLDWKKILSTAIFFREFMEILIFTEVNN
jgi:hypothetical protein